MIDIISQPDNWMSAYEPNEYEFRLFKSVGTFNISATGGKIFIDAGIGIINFTVGQYVKFTVSAVDYFGKIISVASNIALLDLPGIGTHTTIPIYTTGINAAEFELFCGKLSVGEPLVSVVRLNAIFRNGSYKTDLQGYLQTLFTNLAPHPVEGNDLELAIQYKLKVNYEGAAFDVGTIKNCAYSTLQELNATEFVTLSSPLRVGPLEMFNSKKSIYSRIIGNRINTYLNA